MLKTRHDCVLVQGKTIWFAVRTGSIYKPNFQPPEPRGWLGRLLLDVIRAKQLHPRNTTEAELEGTNGKKETNTNRNRPLMTEMPLAESNCLPLLYTHKPHRLDRHKSEDLCKLKEKSIAFLPIAFLPIVVLNPPVILAERG